MICPLDANRFCSANVDAVPFDPDGVWLPLAVEAVSAAAALRFLLLLLPFVVALPPANEDEGPDD